ncbi:MAG TPA: transposase, partial [Candidatus Acidoferrum sp.]|nr:transposase [Candidatus Acidoferrum sp.]
RLYQIIAGYEDTNDADRLRHDPAFQILADQPLGELLGSQPTLSRWENAPSPRDLLRLQDALLDWFVKICGKQVRKQGEILLDVHSTDDPTHGQQQLDRLEQRLAKKPQQMVADSGYSTRENIEKMATREIDFLGTMRYENVPRGANLPNRLPPSAFLYQPEKNHCVCPEGKILHSAGRRKSGPGMIYHLYEARLEDCQACSRNQDLRI